MNIQYLGFEQDLTNRTYAFRVIETLKPDREFQFSVDTQLLTATKFKFQDIPDLCFAKLKRDLASEAIDQVVALRTRITEAELNRYIADHYQSRQKRS